MSKSKFVLNRSGVRELMQSDEMINVLSSYGNAAMSALGDGYEMTTYVGKNRANVRIEAVTNEARRDNSEHNTLLKAVGI